MTGFPAAVGGFEFLASRIRSGPGGSLLSLTLVRAATDRGRHGCPGVASCERARPRHRQCRRTRSPVDALDLNSVSIAARPPVDSSAMGSGSERTTGRVAVECSLPESFGGHVHRCHARFGPSALVDTDTVDDAPLIHSLGRSCGFGGGEAESFPRHDIADPLMATLEVALVHPPIQLLPRVSDRVERLAVQELSAQRLVPALHLAGRGRRPGPNRPVNTLPSSVRISRGTPWVRIACASASHTGRAVARSTTRAEITNLE
jgi:hypothetical protein